MKLRLLGYFDKNFGDDVMQLITVNAFPEHEFYVYGEQREFCLHLNGCPNVHIVTTPPEADAFVNVIGTGFKYDTKKTLALKALTFFREESFSNKKSAVIDCSMDTPKNALQKFFIKRELNKYDLISCRDALSEQWIKTLAPKKRIARHADLVFSLNRQLLCENTGEGCLGIVPVQRAGSSENYAYYTALAQAADDYSRRHGKKVLLFAFDTGYENDLLAAMSIKKLMRNAAQAEIIAYDADPSLIFRHMARCAVLVSSRFHGVIAGLLSGIPTAAISDTGKIDLLAKELGFSRIDKQRVSGQAVIDLAERVRASEPLQLSEEWLADSGKHLEELRICLASGETKMRQL